MMKYLGIFLFLVPPLCIQPAAAQSAADSLEGILRGASGAERILLLIELSEAAASADPERATDAATEALDLLEADPNAGRRADALFWRATAFNNRRMNDEAIADARQSLTIAEERDSERQIDAANELLGGIYTRIRDYEQALPFLREAAEGYRARDLKEDMGRTLLLMGNVYNNQGSYDLAVQTYEAALEVWREIDHQSGLGNTLSNIGVAFRRKGDYDRALEYYFQALEVREAAGDQSGTAATLTNLGVVNYFLENYDQSLNFHSRALAIHEEAGNQEGVASALSNVGVSYDQLGRFDEALESLTRSLELEREHNDRQGEAGALNNIGLVYQHREEFPRALDYYAQALAIKREINDPAGVANTLTNVAQVRQLQGRYASARSVLEEAVAIAEDIGHGSLKRDSYKQLSEVYESEGRFAEALESYKKYKVAQDSLLNGENQAVIARLQTEYQTKEQQQRIELLQQDREIQNLWLGGLVGGVVLLSLLAGLVYSRYRFRTKAHTALTEAHQELQTTHKRLTDTKEQLVHAEKMASLGQLTAGIAHEIRNPLNFVINFSRLNLDLAGEFREEMAALKSRPIEEFYEEFDAMLTNLSSNASVVNQHGLRMNAIVEKMVQHAGPASTMRVSADVNALVDGYVDLARLARAPAVEGAGIDIEKQFDPNVPRVSVLERDVGQAIMNIVENAIDAVSERKNRQGAAYSPKIVIATRHREGNVEIEISDNGPGVSDTIRDKIFNPFFTTKSGSQGTGLGLSLSYDIVKGHGGELTLDAGRQEGALFCIKLPI